MSDPLQTHHIASLTNEEKTQATNEKKTQATNEKRTRAQSKPPKDKNTFNVPKVDNAAKRKAAEEQAAAEYDTLDEAIFTKRRELYNEFPEYVDNPSVRSFDFELEEQPTIHDLREEMAALEKLEEDLRSGKHQKENSKEPTETNQGGSYDQKVISSVLPKTGSLVTTIPYDATYKILDTAKNKFDSQLNNLLSALLRLPKEGSLSSEGQKQFIRSAVAHDCQVAVLSAIQSSLPEENLSSKLEQITVSDMLRGIKKYLHNNQITRHETSEERVKRMARDTLDTIRSIKITPSAVIGLQTQIYYGQITQKYVEDPDFIALAFPNDYNQNWADTVHNALRNSKPETTLHSFWTFKAEEDRELEDQRITEADARYLSNRYKLTRFFRQFKSWIFKAQAAVINYSCFLKQPPGQPDTSGNKTGRGKKTPTGRPATTTKVNGNSLPRSKDPNCQKCGNFHRTLDRECGYVRMKHPDVNTEDKPWEESTKGKLYAGKGKKSLVWNTAADGTSLNWSTDNTNTKTTNGKIIHMKHHHVNAFTSNINSVIPPITLRCPQAQEGEASQVDLGEVLIDTGAMTFTLINRKVIHQLGRELESINRLLRYVRRRCVR
jgi:hypothetical protein